jgi:TonB family protein
LPAAAITFQLLGTSAAAAQLPFGPSAPPQAAPRAIPPTLLESAQASYPEAAQLHGLEASVALRLTIDEAGRVSEVEVLEPAGHGFDEAAREAAGRFRFAPAQRDGTPIVSRIHYRYVFELPREAAAPAWSAQPPAQQDVAAAPSPVPAPARPAPAAVDVSVQGRLNESQRLRQSAEAVNVVDMRRPREQSADLGEVLARNQGVVVRRDGGLGSDERFSLNGLYDEQIRFFLNGIPLDVAGYSFGIASMPINLVERVEIYRGVVPVRFGSDALGGAVNLVSDQSYLDHASASYQLGSFGTHRVTLSGRYRHEASGLTASGSAFFDRAANDYHVDVEIPDERGRLSPARVPRFHDGYRAYGGTVEAGVVDRRWAKRLLLSAFYGRTDKDIQHNVVMTVPYGEVTWGSSVIGSTARYEVNLSEQLSLELVGAYSKRTTDFRDRSRWVYNWRGERIRERRVAGEIEAKPRDQLHWQHAAFARAGTGWQIAAGHVLRVSSAFGYATRTGDERLQLDAKARDPLTAERKLWTLISGAEYQLDLLGQRLSNVFFVKDYAYDMDAEEPLPGGIFRRREASQHREGIGNALRFRVAPWLYAKASYERATQLPSADKVFGDGVLIQANLELLPEVSHNLNAGPRLELSRTAAGDFALEINGFLRDTERQIVLLGNDRFFSYQNVYHSRTVGVESGGSWVAPRRWLSIESALTWLDQRNASEDGAFRAFKGDRIPNRPYLTASWGGRLRFAGFPQADDTLEPFYHGRYVHEFFRGWESQGLRELKQVVEQQLLHTAGVSYTLSDAFGRLTATAEVENLTDTRAYDNYGVERPGRGYYVKVSGEL